MEDKIKKYLEDFEVPYKEEHWNLMEERMAIEELSDYMKNEDKAFDDYVKKELAFEEPAYNPKHWALMAEKLEERSWRGFIRRYKVAEVSLLLLLLWTFWFTIIPHNENPSVAFNNIETKKPIQVQASVVPKTSASVIRNNTVIAQSRKKAEELHTLDNISISIAYQRNNKLEGLGTFNTIHKSIQPAILDRNITASIFHTTKYNSYKSDNIASDRPIHFAKTNPDIRIGVFAASGIESISQEEKTNLKEEPNLAFGYGGGISLGLKFKDIELETGASYNALVPFHVSEDATASNNTRKSSESIKEEEVANKFLKLPFALKYLFDNEGSWKFYALGGGNLHIDVNNKDFQQRSSSLSFDSRAISRESSLASNQLNQGVTFFDRFYYSASIGFGVERQISERMSIFIQPEYYHQLYRSTLALGTGQTNTFTLSFGLKSNL